MGRKGKEVSRKSMIVKPQTMENNEFPTNQFIAIV